MRRSAENPNGPIMVVVLMCLAVALTFTSFGLGFLNFATNNRIDARGEQELEPAPEIVKTVDPVKQLEVRAASLTREVGKQTRNLDEKRTALTEYQGQAERITSEISQDAARLEQLRDRVRALAQEVQELRRKLSTRSGRSQVIELAEQRLAQARAALTAMEERVKRLETVAIDQKSVDPAEVLAGARFSRSALMIECRQDGLVLLPKGDHIPAKGLASNPSLASAVKGTRVVLLVRPSGFKSLEKVRASLERMGAKGVGYEPFDEEWLLRYQVEAQFRGGSNAN